MSTYPWNTVSCAFLNRYPNPFATHVLSADTVAHRLDSQTGELHITRLLRKTNSIPRWARSIMRGNDAYILEHVVVDPENGTLVSKTRNITHTRMLKVEEKQTLVADPFNTDRTLCKNETSIVSNIGYGLNSRIENFSLSRFSENIAKSRKGMLYVLDLAQRKGLFRQRLRMEQYLGPQARDFYQRPGQRSTSTEKEKKFINKGHFLTHLTSVNIATAFARAHITSDTIKRRPAHLKGTPMSPSQIPRMNLSEVPDEHDPRAHFESAAAPRSHGVRPIRDVTSKTSLARPGQGTYEQMDIDQPAAFAENNQADSGLAHGFLRERNWDLYTTAAPAWLRRAQDQRNNDLLHESPPHNLVNTPSHVLSSRTGAAPPSYEPLTNNLIDLNTPHPDKPAVESTSAYARDGSARVHSKQATAEKPSRLGATSAASKASSHGHYSNVDAANGYDPELPNELPNGTRAAAAAAAAAGQTPGPQPRYRLRSQINTPGRLNYDHEFNPHETGHDQYSRRSLDAASQKSNPIPTPYTARIKGPGAFPGTAQRFSQRRSNAQNGEEFLSPTGPRSIGSRTASGHAALAEGDLLTNHRYLSHGAASHRGWGEYTQDRDAAERETVHSFTGSFISNSTSGGEGNAGAYERDNPTLFKRLLRNIAAGWSGSQGSFAERVSFVFFMIYFLIKETCVVLGSFLVRLLFNFVIGPVYTGIREVVLLPASLWHVLNPGNSHDVAGSMRGILTGLSVVALSLVVAQYGQSLFSSLGSLPTSLVPGNWKPLQRIEMPAQMEPLTEDEIERLGGRGSAVVDRLVSMEQTLSHLYSLLDTLKTHREEETQDVRESLKRLQQERQTLLDAKRTEQQRIDNLEREYSSMKRDLKASTAKGAESTKLGKELQNLQKYVDKLAKSGAGRGKGAGPSIDEVQRLVNEAIHAQEKRIKDMLQPEWLASDGDAAYANVARMIEDALNRYSNDRLGKADFALYSAGARIIPEMTSPTFEPPARRLLQKLWRGMGMVSSQPPTTILDPDTHIGECWPMRGSSGQVAIHLAQPVDVTDFALEHIAKSIAIDWRSAPRSIEVWGYALGAQKGSAPSSTPSEPSQGPIVSLDLSGGRVTPRPFAEAHGRPSAEAGANSAARHGVVAPAFDESNKNYGPSPLVLLASHEYAPSDTAALQIIRPMTESTGADGTIRVRTIILKVNSNWGHPDHTCLYRFRVHGHPADA
ncbi:hypothetical protein EV183_005090 [Coemansia sp. RSA 2336]|nr:hypothetical protein EV183_005090 [Coemansia sp. RSA 2336]